MNRFLHTNIKHLYRSLIALASIMFLPITLMGQSVEISTTSGNVGSALRDYTLSEITSLKVSGTLDATDFKIIRDNLSSCTEIDLSGVSSINKYEGYYGTWTNVGISGGMGSDRDGWYSYPLFELPTQAFSGWHSGSYYGWDRMQLSKVTLPPCIKSIGDNAFRQMYTLQEILISEDNNYFKSINGVLYSKDGTQLRLYPFGRKEAYTLPAGVTSISTDGISDASFTTLTLLTATPPTLETHEFTAQTVYVPEGSINAYKEHEHWKRYNLKEIGDIKVTKGKYDDLNGGFTLINAEFQGWITYKKSEASAKLMIRFQLKDKSWASSITMQYADAFDGETSTCSFDNDSICWIPMTDTNAEKCLWLASTKLGSMEYHIDIYNEKKTKSLYSEDGIFQVIEPVVVDLPQKITGSIDEQIPFTIKISNSGIFKGKELSIQVNAYSLPLESTSLFYIKDGQSQKINMSNVVDGINVTEGTFKISLSDGEYSLAIQSTTATENASLNCYLLESDNAYFRYDKYPNEQIKVEISGKKPDTPTDIFAYNGLKYQIISDNTVSVIGPDVVEGSGTEGNDNDSWTVTDCVIPSTITHNSTTYQVKAIEDGAFSGAIHMKTITLPEGLETIGYEAFYRCYELKTLHIPASVTSIKAKEDEAFFSKLDIESISVASGNKEYASLDGLLYNKKMTTLLFCPYFDKNKEVTLPEGVTALRKYAFAYQDALTSVTFPESLKSIGNNAFYECEGLVNIHFKSQQPPVLAGESVFESSKLAGLIAYVPKGCKNAYTDWGGFLPENIIEEGSEEETDTFTEGLFKYRKLTENTVAVIGSTITGNACDIISPVTHNNKTYQVTEIGDEAFMGLNIEKGSIPEGIRKIGSNAYENCALLEYMILPSSVEEIKYDAFNGCKKLERIQLNDGLKYIGGNAFNNTALTCIQIPASVIEIEYLGEDCPSLMRIDVDSKNAYYSSEGGILYDKKQTVMLMVPQTYAGDISNLPETLKTIDNGAFYKCKGIKTIDLPEGIETIGECAFSLCGTTFITLPSTLKQLDMCVFGDHEEAMGILKELHSRHTDPAQIKIESNTFAYVIDFNTCKLYVPKGCKAKYQATEGWKNFKNIIEEGETTGTTFTIGLLKYTVIADNEVAISGVTDKTQEGYDIKPTVEHQGKTYTVTAVGDKAFYECTNLVRFQPERFKMAIKTIGSEAFRGCSKLINLLLNTGLEQIGESAFCECSSLNNFEIPASVTQIGDWAFNDCPKLANISVNSANKYYTSSTGVLFNKDLTTLLVYPNMQGSTNYIVPKSVTKIEAYAFDNCTNLPAIVLPEKLKEIGGAAFYNCSKLTSITLPANLSEIGGEAFGECKGIKSFTIPASVTSLGEYIFTKCENTLQEIHCKGTTPPDICKECGYGIFSSFGTPVTTCKLYVPNGSKATYSKALGWKDFKYILEEGENPPLIPDKTDDEIILNTDSTYTDGEGNTGHFNGMIGNGEEETVINKLTIKGSATSTTTTITFNHVTVGNGSSTTETTTSVTKNTNVVIELIGDNSLGKLVNDGIAKLISKVEAALKNTVVINNGTFVDETGLLTRVEGAAELDITAPSDQEVRPGENVTLTASTKVSVTYAVTFIWEQLQPDGTWKAVGSPNVYTPARSGLRSATTVTDRLTIQAKNAGKYRCVIRNKVGNVSSTLTTLPATVTTKGTVDIVIPKSYRKVTPYGNQLHFEISTPTEVNIINLNGVIIRSVSLPAGDTYIDGLYKGVYILLFEDGVTQKVRI